MQNKEINIAIAIIGRISSGKSTFAMELSNHYNITIASFGSYLKNYCENKGLKTDRETLQNIGEDFINNKPISLLWNVVTFSRQNSNDFIFEGVRHLMILEELKKSSKKYFSVFIDADHDTRFERYLERNKDSDKNKTLEQFNYSDNHPVELEIESLKNECDLIVDSRKYRFIDFLPVFDKFISNNSY
jgi:dephospho-CoA kinase